MWNSCRILQHVRSVHCIADDNESGHSRSFYCLHLADAALYQSLLGWQCWRQLIGSCSQRWCMTAWCILHSIGFPSIWCSPSTIQPELVFLRSIK